MATPGITSDRFKPYLQQLRRNKQTGLDERAPRPGVHSNQRSTIGSIAAALFIGGAMHLVTVIGYANIINLWMKY